MSEVVIFGTGELAAVVRHYLTFNGNHEVVAHTVDRSYMGGGEFEGLPLVPFETVEEAYPPGRYSMLVAVGYQGQGANELRARRYEEAKTKGYKLITYIDKRSVIAEGVEIGDNCIISANQTIEPFVKIGNNVVIRSGSYIGHHVAIGDHCFIAAHVAISGRTIIEPYAFLGTNSTIRNDIKIGKGCIIGAGALILADTGEYEAYKGLEGELLPKKSFEVNI